MKLSSHQSNCVPTVVVAFSLSLARSVGAPNLNSAWTQSRNLTKPTFILHNGHCSIKPCLTAINHGIWWWNCVIVNLQTNELSLPAQKFNWKTFLISFCCVFWAQITFYELPQTTLAKKNFNFSAKQLNQVKFSLNEERVRERKKEKHRDAQISPFNKFHIFFFIIKEGRINKEKIEGHGKNWISIFFFLSLTTATRALCTMCSKWSTCNTTHTFVWVLFYCWCARAAHGSQISINIFQALHCHSQYSSGNNKKFVRFYCLMTTKNEKGLIAVILGVLYTNYVLFAQAGKILWELSMEHTL